MTELAGISLSRDVLAASRWSLGEEGLTPWSTSIYFCPNGKIGGYKSPNEVTWSLENSVLRIFTEAEQEMWRFHEIQLINGTLRAVGSFQKPNSVGNPCLLKEVDKRAIVKPTVERLIGSRWSLGQDGMAPWSTTLYFRPGGKVGGYKSPNEVYWSLEQSVLRIFTAARDEMWRFDEFDVFDDKLTAVSKFQNSDAGDTCSLKEVETHPGIVPTEEDFTQSRWSLGEEWKTPWSTAFYFCPDGTIGGYSSPNEVFWTLEGAILKIFTETNREMWRFNALYLVNGGVLAIGESEEMNAGDYCLLTELRSEKLPSEEHLITSRWSLGEEGKAPWSTRFFFRPFGKIGGYESPNEASWSLKASALEIFTRTNEKMWRFNDFETVDGRLRSTGTFERKTGVQDPCILIEMPADNMPDEQRLTTSRWSLGRERETPWSTAFYFRPDGRIGGYKSPNEVYWNLRGSVLRIFTADNKEMWRFEHFDLLDGRQRSRGSFQMEKNVNGSCILAELPDLTASTDKTKRPAVEEAAPSTVADDSVKLIIWDLDDTFWSGTLAEGGIEKLDTNIDFVKTMTARGILNSICSKNDFAQTKAQLQELGIWDYFIFPQIEYAPKGAMVQKIIDRCQIRTASVLFIDDNIVNLNEALHYNQGLQVCGPRDVTALLSDARCAGKPDPEMVRLGRYKILEQKSAERSSNPVDNLDFLRQSGVCISFHADVEAEFPRIHDLVNRTNQLNFTKKRWPEREEDALATFHREADEHFDAHSGYIKVADRYGQYGICGFYMVRNGECQHFLFSCRTLDMGIEQFVWQKLGRPYVSKVGEVVSSLGDTPNWISIVDDAELEGQAPEARPEVSICVRGACDLAMMTHYLRMNFETIEEFTFPYLGWGIHSCARAIALHDELSHPKNRALIDKLPGLPKQRFDSAINTGRADVYVLSFSSEFFGGLYRSKSTGMVLPLDFMPFAKMPPWKKEFRDMDFEVVKDEPFVSDVSMQQWQFLQDELDFVGGFNGETFREDVLNIFSKLRGKTVIVLMLNTDVGSGEWILSSFKKVNDIVRPLTEEFRFHRLEMSHYVSGVEDLVAPDDGGVHFNRRVYRDLARKIGDIVMTTRPALALATS